MSIRITKLHLVLSLMAVSLTAFFFIQLNTDNSLGNIFSLRLPIRISIERAQTVQKAEPIPQSESKLVKDVNFQHVARQTIAIAGEEMKIAKRNYLDISTGQATLRHAKQLFAQASFTRAIQEAKASINEFKQAPLRMVTSYRVKRGDCLWNISKRKDVYGKGAKWVVIWRANEEKIPDFDLIYSNQVFTVPRN